MLKTILPAVLLLMAATVPAQTGAQQYEPRNTRTIAKPKPPAANQLGRDPSVCGDDEAVARIEAQSGSTARAFDKVARGTEEGRVGRALEVNGDTYTTTVCRNDDSSVLIFIRNRSAPVASQPETNPQPENRVLRGGISNAEEGRALSAKEGGSDVPGSFFRYPVDMRDTFDTVIGSCGTTLEQEGSLASRPSCLSAANVEGCERYRINNPTCIAIIAQGPKLTTKELDAGPMQVMDDCSPAGTTLQGQATVKVKAQPKAKTKAKPQLRTKACPATPPFKARQASLDDTPPQTKPIFDPSKPLEGSVREVGPIVINGRTYKYGRGEPYYNGTVTIVGISTSIPFTIDVSKEENHFRIIRKIDANYGKPKYVEGTVAPVSDSQGNLIGLKFTVTKVDRADGKGIKPIKAKAQTHVTLRPSKDRLVSPQFKGF